MEALPLLLCQFINPIDMELKHKKLYQSPVTIVVELKQEGVICTSGLRDSYGDINDGIDPGLLDGDGIWNW